MNISLFHISLHYSLFTIHYSLFTIHYSHILHNSQFTFLFLLHTYLSVLVNLSNLSNIQTPQPSRLAASSRQALIIDRRSDYALYCSSRRRCLKGRKMPLLGSSRVTMCISNHINGLRNQDLCRRLFVVVPHIFPNW